MSSASVRTRHAGRSGSSYLRSRPPATGTGAVSDVAAVAWFTVLFVAAFYTLAARNGRRWSRRDWVALLMLAAAGLIWLAA